MIIRFILILVILPALSPTPFNRLAIAGQVDCFDPYVVNRSVPYCLRIIGITRKSYLKEGNSMENNLKYYFTFGMKQVLVIL